MTSGAGFEAYLASKRIDSTAFRTAEPELWEAWKKEFDQLHPNSFTVQKLNLINPIRRKYQLQPPAVTTSDTNAPEGGSPIQPGAPPAKPPGKPVMRSRPKMDRGSPDQMS